MTLIEEIKKIVQKQPVKLFFLFFLHLLIFSDNAFSQIQNSPKDIYGRCVAVYERIQTYQADTEEIFVSEEPLYRSVNKIWYSKSADFLRAASTLIFPEAGRRLDYETGFSGSYHWHQVFFAPDDEVRELGCSDPTRKKGALSELMHLGIFPLPNKTPRHIVEKSILSDEERIRDGGASFVIEIALNRGRKIRYWIEDKTWLIVKIEFYDNGQLMKSTAISNIVIDQPLPPDVWEPGYKKARRAVKYDYYPGGKLKEIRHYQYGKAEGVGKIYYKNGMLRYKKPYRNDKKHGVTVLYYPNGWLHAVSRYKEGKIDGVMKEYYKGRLVRKITFKNGKIEGFWRTYYYKCGKLREEVPYVDNKPNGLAKYYNSKGRLIRQAIYRDGKITE